MKQSSSWSSVRCLFESPILDEHKWAKVSSIPADAFILDLEDAVPAPGKERAREKVVEFIGRPEYFDGRITVARPNPLSTPWGRDDIIALAAARAPIVMLSKVNSAAEIDEALALFSEHGHLPQIVSSIESAAGVLNVESIFSHQAVVASTFGPGDLHVDVGMALYEPDGSMNPGLIYPKVKTILAGVAHGVPVLGIAYSQDIKDLDLQRERLAAEKRLGFSGSCAFYPPHVAIINEIFTPSDEEIEHSREVVNLYEAAVANGNPAVHLPNGQVVLMHQYEEALRVLNRAREHRPSR